MENYCFHHQVDALTMQISQSKPVSGCQQQRPLSSQHIGVKLHTKIRSKDIFSLVTSQGVTLMKNHVKISTRCGKFCQQEKQKHTDFCPSEIENTIK